MRTSKTSKTIKKIHCPACCKIMVLRCKILSVLEQLYLAVCKKIITFGI